MSSTSTWVQRSSAGVKQERMELKLLAQCAKDLWRCARGVCLGKNAAHSAQSLSRAFRVGACIVNWWILFLVPRHYVSTPGCHREDGPRPVRLLAAHMTEVDRNAVTSTCHPFSGPGVCKIVPCRCKAPRQLRRPSARQRRRLSAPQWPASSPLVYVYVEPRLGPCLPCSGRQKLPV